MTQPRAPRSSARARFAALAVIALALGLVASIPAPAPAHEGHVHEDEPAVALPVVAGAPRVAHSDHHELLVRIEAAAAGEPAHVHLLLADAETNEPIEDATLEVSVAGTDTAWTATKLGPGIYEAHLPDPDHGLDILVRRGEDLDLLAIDSVAAGQATLASAAGAPGGEKKSSGSAVWIALAAAMISIVVAISAASRLRRSKARALVLIVGLGLAGLTSSVGRTHEGELHGDEKEAQSTGVVADRIAGAGAVAPGARYIAKEAQFEIGLRTESVREESLAPVRTAFGTIVEDPSATARVVAPQTGRFVSARAWRLGDRLARGQKFGAVLVVDELPVRAPQGGTIAGLEVVPGQTVAAGQVLATLVDLSRVRIELPLYGDALAAGMRARGASVRLPALPERPFAARIEGLAPGGTSGGPAAPLVVSAANPDGLLRPGMIVEVALEEAVAEPALTVPAAALVTTEQGPALFVKIAPEAFVLRAVTLGARAAGRVAVVRGVAAGERVVIAGLAPLLATAEAAR